MNRDHINRDYCRTTRVCTLDEVRPDLLAAIRQHVAEKLLGDVAAEQLMCVETKTERLAKRGGFGRHDWTASNAAHYTAAIITPTWLIWAMTTSTHGALAFSAQVRQVNVKNAERRASDEGITLIVPTSNAGETSSVFIGLEPGAAKDRFKDILRQAIGLNR